MPTFTTVALDSIIEPKASKSMAAGRIMPESKLQRRNSNSTISRQGNGINGADRKPESRNSMMAVERKNHWKQISPALYATPEPTPLPDSPSSFPPSPYIVDHKRRGPRLSKTFSEDDAVLREALVDEKTVETGKSLESEDVGSSKVLDTTDTVSSDVEDNHVKFLDSEDLRNSNTSNEDEEGQDNTRKSSTLERDNEIDDFFDPQDSMSVRSSADGEINYGQERSLISTAQLAEFYDAWEELSSEIGTPHHPNDTEAELRDLRLGFLMEKEKRKHSENRLNEMRSQWGRIREQLSLVGLSLPGDPTMLEDEPAEDPGEELCRQVDLLRFVSNSVGRGIARAELEVEMEAQLQSKNFEIARLLDRLHYYEAVNHEMSQRNQESVETMRRLRQRRKRRQRWIWGSIAAAITLGSTALAWSYLPTAKGSSPLPPHTTESNHRSGK